MIKAGEFEIDVWKSGYPVWCVIKYRGAELAQVHHNELSDLKYAVEKAMHTARGALQDRDKHEV